MATHWQFLTRLWERLVKLRVLRLWKVRSKMRSHTRNRSKPLDHGESLLAGFVLVLGQLVDEPDVAGFLSREQRAELQMQVGGPHAYHRHESVHEPTERKIRNVEQWRIVHKLFSTGEKYLTTAKPFFFFVLLTQPQVDCTVEKRYKIVTKRTRNVHHSHIHTPRSTVWWTLVSPVLISEICALQIFGVSGWQKREECGK